MAKTSSKSSAKAAGKNRRNHQPQPQKSNFLRRFLRKLGRGFQSLKTKIRDFRAKHIHLHKSFKRSYREDYMRQTSTPGLLSHAMITFKTIFKHWRTFLPFIALMVALYMLMVGLMSEEFYQQFQTSIDQTNAEISAENKLGNFAKAGLLLISTVTTGGLTTGMDETGMVFMILLFLMMWLITIYLLRHFLAGRHPRLRDGLYNALAPLLSTLVIFVIIFIQAIPLMLVIISYSVALATDFLSMPFYALLYFIFASLMLLLSGYLLSSSIMALVAVTAPGIYPLTAVFAASDLMAGRRIRMVLRILYLFLVVALIYIITILPIILLDLWLKSIFSWLSGWAIVPFCLLVVTCFVFIYATTYIYLYYRWLLDYKEK